jgi:hypothetical protein
MRMNRWWLIVVASSGGLLAAYLFIVLSQLVANGDAKQIAVPVAGVSHRAGSARFSDWIAAKSGGLYLGVELSEAERAEAEHAEMKRRLKESEEAYKRAKQQFAQAHPLVKPLSIYSEQMRVAWEEKWYDLVRRHRNFFYANARTLNTLRDINYEASGVFGILELAKSQEQLGAGTLADAVNEMLDHPKVFNKLKKDLLDTVTKHLKDPIIASQIENASDRDTLAEISARAASAIRATNINALSQTTADPEWQAVFDEELWVRAIGWVEREYRQSFPSNVDKLANEWQNARFELRDMENRSAATTTDERKPESRPELGQSP